MREIDAPHPGSRRHVERRHFQLFQQAFELPSSVSPSEFPADLRADAEVVLFAFADVVCGVGPEQPGAIDRNLIADSEAVLWILGADPVILEGLHHGHLEDELLIEIEQVLQADRAAPGIRRRVVQLWVSGQRVGFEIDADILQYPGVVAVDQRLRVAETDEEVGVGHKCAWQAGDQAVFRNDCKAVAVALGIVPEVCEQARRIR